MSLDIETLKGLQTDLKCENMDKVAKAVAHVGRLRYTLLDEVVRLREECETGAALVLELRGELEETEAATQDYDHISAVLDGVPVNGPLNPLAARVAKLQAERDEARAEVERLRELVSPTTPAGKLTAYWAAGEIRKNPPKVAEWTGDGWRSCTGEVVAMVGDAGYMICRGPRIPDGTNYTPGTPDDCKNALRAAGWELAGGTE